MAIISDTTKIDKAFKFVSGKGYTTTQKGVDNEDAASGFIIGTSSIFSQDAGIPPTAPGTSTSILTYYGAGTPARFRMIYDVSSPQNKAWYASTDGSSLNQMRATRVPNWVPPTFGNYTIRIFLTVGVSTTTTALQEIFFSDATSPLFDYKTGILTFESDPLAAYASILGGPPDGIQISGYVYTGPLLSQIFDGNGNFTGGLSDFGTSTSLAAFVNPNKSLEISSPFATPTTWISETTPYGTSSIAFLAAGQFPNGEGIVAGTGSGSSVIAYSWGHGTWRKPTFVPGSMTTPTGVWCSTDDITAYICDVGGHIFQSVDSGRDWTNLGTQAFITRAIWGSSQADIFVVGNGGNIIHSTNGTSFSAQTNADAHDLYSIWGSSSVDIFAVGTSGTIRHSIGAGTWTGQTSGTANNLFVVFGFSSTEIYAGGASGTLLTSPGGGTWSSFNSGLPSTFTVTGLYGVSSGTTKKLYASGFDTSSNNYKVYVSSGTNSWSVEATYTGPETQSFIIAGGISGIFGGLDVGRVAVLHKNPVEIVHGHTRFDGYLSVRGSVDAKNADLTTLNLTPTAPTTSFGYPAITVNPATAVNYTALSAVSTDSGEGFRFWRESSSIYTLDVGSQVTNANDGVTPFAAGGRIRLGGFTTSPSTTARGEIETVSSVGLKIAAYQGHMTIANQFGTVGSTAGDVNITTQSGTIRLTTAGNETPYPAGQILISPATSAYVLTTSNTTSTKFEVQSPGGNYNIMYGNGSFSNNGGISTTSSVSAGTSVSGASGSFTGSMTAGSVVVTGGNISTSTNMVVQAGSVNLTLFQNAGFNLQTAAGTNSYVLWPNGSSTLSTFRTQGYLGNYNIMDSNGVFQNSSYIQAGSFFYIAGSTSNGYYGWNGGNEVGAFTPTGRGQYAVAGGEYYIPSGSYGEAAVNFRSRFTSTPSSYTLSSNYGGYGIQSAASGTYGVNRGTVWGCHLWFQSGGTGMNLFAQLVYAF